MSRGRPGSGVGDLSAPRARAKRRLLAVRPLGRLDLLCHFRSGNKDRAGGAGDDLRADATENQSAQGPVSARPDDHNVIPARRRFGDDLFSGIAGIHLHLGRETELAEVRVRPCHVLVCMGTKHDVASGLRSAGVRRNDAQHRDLTLTVGRQLRSLLECMPAVFETVVCKQDPHFRSLFLSGAGGVASAGFRLI
jgi:hypothetical protein